MLGYGFELGLGRPVIAGGQPVATPVQSEIMFQHAPEAEALERWQRREFLEAERQHASPEAGSSASLPLLVIGHSCICRRKGGLDAETEELVHGDPRPGAAGSALCDPVVARQRFHGKD
jgi:hypothetical protein